MIKKANYHTHTNRCNHAIGSDEEYVFAAIKAGYDVLGITDHTPWNLFPFEHGRNRMRMDGMDAYVSSIHHLKGLYADQIDIKLGVEAEYFRDRFDWLIAMIDKHKLDLVVFGNHYRGFESQATYYGSYKDRTNLYKHYVEDAIDGMATGVYSIFGHPDLFFRSNNVVNSLALEAAQEICDAANHYNVVLEYNLGGVRDGNNVYPKPEFWEVVAKNKNLTVIGVDAHTPKHLLDDKTRNLAKEYLKSIGVNLTEVIDLKKIR